MKSSKFWNYVLYNYLRKIKSKAFIGFNIFLIIVGLLISQLGSIVKFFNETFDYSETIYIVDETNQLYSQFQKDFNNLLPEVILEQGTESEDVLNQKVEDGDISAYFIINYTEQNLLSATYVAKDFSNSSYYTIGEQVLSGYNKQIAMKSAKLTQEQVNLLNQNFSMEKISLDENAQTAEESMGNLAIAYIAIILIFLFSYLYSVYAGQEIMEEKTSRVMEIIITSISPIKQLYGKIVYNSLYALTQLTIFMLLFTISIQYMLKSLPTEVLDTVSVMISPEQAKIVIYIIIFAIVAYLVYLVSVLILSSIISSVEEYQIAISPIMVIGLVSFYIGIFGMTAPEAPFIKIMSMIPFISPYIMPLRVATMTVSTPMIWLSIALNIVVIVVILTFGARVYKNGVLNYSGDSVIKKFIQATKKS
ncbi:ABC-2 family transporter protein [Turicibacter sanguinis]|nr:ABC-2 family transporter protein [Turicibacter sanguinis]